MRMLITFQYQIYLQKEDIGLIETFQNIEMLHKFYFLEEIFLVSCIFLVRGIVDNINEITNNKVIPTRLQKVKLDSCSSPNEIVSCKYNFN